MNPNYDNISNNIDNSAGNGNNIDNISEYNYNTDDLYCDNTDYTKTDNSHEEKQSSEDKQKKFKYGLFLLNNGWNDKNESLLATIGTNAQIYKKVHTQVHIQYKIINYIYGILLVFLNAGLFCK